MRDNAPLSSKFETRESTYNPGDSDNKLNVPLQHTKLLAAAH